jgi:mycothione reductase
MNKFDLIVIGSGAGTHVASQASNSGLQVALVDRGPTGGTCLNNGCIPSKMLIYPADVIRTLQDAGAVGVDAGAININFSRIMRRMHSVVDESRRELEKAIAANENITWYKATGEFTGDYTLKAGEENLTAPKIVIATGARALIPPIRGLQETGFIDNVSLLNLQKPPKSLIVIGAGYIGCEFGHFFSAMGTEVTILGRSPAVLNNEDPEICKIVKEVLSKNMKVLTGHEVVEAERLGDRKVVSAINRSDNKTYKFEAEEILLAAGRRSNSDLLRPEKTGVETDGHGWIRVNEFLETTKKGIWALGDALGKHMFRHTANYESDVVAHNILRAESEDDREMADFHAVPHAVFTHPQVAGVGLTEAEALEKGNHILVGRARYTDVAKGIAMAEDHGFVKVVVEEDTGKILGCSVAGSEAPALVQQVVYLMNTDYQDLMPMIKSQVIHPTINEVMTNAFANLEHPYHHAGEYGESQ